MVVVLILFLRDPEHYFRVGILESELDGVCQRVCRDIGLSGAAKQQVGLAVLRLDVDLIREIERNAVYCGFGVVRCVGHSSDPGSGKTFGCNRSPLAVPVLPLIVIRSGSGSGSGYLHQSLHVVRAFEYLAPVKVVEVNADSVLPDREIRVPSEIGTRPDDPRVCFRGGFHSSGETQRDGFLQYGRLIGKLFPGT